MFDLNLKSRQPVYEQLVDKFKQLIISKVLKEHEKLPSVRQLSSQLTLNPNTIQKAYRELEHQAFIYSLPGKGSFVSPMTDSDNDLRIGKIEDELKSLIAEAKYLGMSKQSCQAIIDTLYENEGGK